MARACRIPCRTATNQPFQMNRQLRRWLAAQLPRLLPLLATSAAASNADRYRKHFMAVGHAILLIFHGLSTSPSLRQTYATFAACPGLLHLSGLAASPDSQDHRLAVSFSQFADSNTTRPAAFLTGIVATLARQVRQQAARLSAAIPPDLCLQDSTFLHLSLKLASWLPNKGGKDGPGLRLQLQYAPAWDLPDHLVITDTHHNDCQGFDQSLLDNPDRLAALHGQTLVLDLGYYSHRRFAQVLAAGIHLVTRRKADASIRVEAALPVQAALPGLPAGRLTVHTDQRVTVGSANNRAGAVLPGLRLVTATVAPLPAAARRGASPVRYEVLTDRWDLTAREVIQIYLWRWQIELFFRWLKRQVRLLPWLGYSGNAVELTVWLAIIVHLLTVLAAQALGWGRRSPTLLRHILWAMARVDDDLMSQPDSTPQAYQLSFPGWQTALAAPT